MELNSEPGPASMRPKKICFFKNTNDNETNLFFGRKISFSHHYQGSIDFNTANIQRNIGMYFLVFTGNRVDIGGDDLQRS